MKPLLFRTRLKLFFSHRFSRAFGMLFFAIPFLAIPLISSLVSEIDDNKLLKNGVEAVGKILNIHENARNTIIIEYQYALNGKLKTDRFETPEVHVRGYYKEGDEIPILVSEDGSLIQNVDRFRLPDHLFYMIPLIFLMCLSPFVIAVLINYIKLKSLYTHGCLLAGKIVSIKQGSSHSFIFFSDTFYRVVFKFTDSMNRERTGRSTTRNLALIANKNKGDEIQLLVFKDKATVYDDE